MGWRIVQGGRRRRRAGTHATATLAGALTAILALPALAVAATIVPNTFGDDFTSGNGVCSLREAISVANQNSTAVEPYCEVDGAFGNDRIELAAGTYELTITGAGDDANASGDLDVDTTGGNLRIVGAGSGATAIVAGAGFTDRIIDHPAGPSNSLLTIEGVRISGGFSPASSGGGVRSATSDAALALDDVRVSGNRAGSFGGGVSQGTGALTLTNSTVAGNESAVSGGGVRTTGIAVINNSVVAGNRVEGASAEGGGGLVMTGAGANLFMNRSLVDSNAVERTSAGVPGGGGIRLTSSVVASVNASTLSRNEVSGGTTPVGGGIDARSQAFVQVASSTLAGNTAQAGGAIRGDNAGTSVNIIRSTLAVNPTSAPLASEISTAAGSQATLSFSIVAAAAGGQACAGNVSSGGGWSVASDASCDPTAEGDLAGVDPRLGPLRDNGGPRAGAAGLRRAVLTRIPRPASPALDIAPPGSPHCTEQSDQRGLPRLAGPGCDSGAIERQQPRLGKLQRQRRTGAARLRVRVPGAGRLVVGGKGVRRLVRVREADGPGAVALRVRLRGRALRQLRKRGRARVNVRVTYTATRGGSQGAPKAVARRVRLVRRR